MGRSRPRLPLGGLSIGLLERRLRGDDEGLAAALVPALEELGGRVEIVRAEADMHRLDVRPPWDLIVMRSTSPAAVHLGAAAEAWGIRCVNASEATRLAQDKLASAAILERAGLPIAPGRAAWLGNGTSPSGLARFAAARLIVKTAAGSQGAGLWPVEPGQILTVAPTLPPGPYLLMDWVPHSGDDLKVFVAGEYLAAIRRPFPAKTPEAKLGRLASVPADVESATRAAGELLGLTCYGCDFVAGPDGWVLVDVNAFPGYKGAPAAARAIAAEVARVADLAGRP